MKDKVVRETSWRRRGGIVQVRIFWAEEAMWQDPEVWEHGSLGI